MVNEKLVVQEPDMITPRFQSKNIRKRHPKCEERIMDLATVAHTVFICGFRNYQSETVPVAFRTRLDHFYTMRNIHCVGVDT